MIAWQNKAVDNGGNFTFPFDSGVKLSENGTRTRVVFSGGDYGTMEFDLATSRYTVYIVTKWQSDAHAGGNAPAQAILAGTDLAETGHGLWYEARSDNEVRYRHRFPFGNGGGDEVFASIYDANEGLNLITSKRTLDSMHLYNGGFQEQLTPLTKAYFSETMRLFLGVNGPSGNGALEGEIAEVLIYEGSHSDTLRTAIDDYLRVKWGLPEGPMPIQ